MRNIAYIAGLVSLLSVLLATETGCITPRKNTGSYA